MTLEIYHATFRKRIGSLEVESYGGGAPRWVHVIKHDHPEAEFRNLSLEQCRDLRYALDRLLDEVG